ncbi:MAG: CopG family transcriptional regulator [Gracilimonas sp.]|uniref:ribbon-helix-helix domain-containing protein n=1 Tax=Gracilimonas TaxID=649462 RepID=UPI001B0BF6B8|nr:CopG family transcriptional regulator [Gracilimonas sp.]MBO6585088.1 CopG family transcriptional regulator [Gracilimonas sp.]MBO6615641.1 CopG family transcriptional regulator [Gracilimonas sp.]
MIRTQIYLTKKEKEAIEQLSGERKTTQSNIIREAIDEYVAKKKMESGKERESIMDFAGIWKHKKDIPRVDVLREDWEGRVKRLDADKDDR